MTPSIETLEYQLNVRKAHEAGEIIEFRLHGFDGWAVSNVPRWSWSDCDYRIAPSKVAEGYNPTDLSEDQVGEGFRLLTWEEHLNGMVEQCEWWTGSSWNASCYCSTAKEAIRTQKPAGYYLPEPVLAPGHNPEKVTVAQLGEGWRLLERDEICPRDIILPGIEVWGGPGSSGWGRGARGIAPSWSYRTKKPSGYYLPKPVLAEGHNPTGLTVEPGQRLITTGELNQLKEISDPDEVDDVLPRQLIDALNLREIPGHWRDVDESSGFGLGVSTRASEPHFQALLMPYLLKIVAWDCPADVPIPCAFRRKDDKHKVFAATVARSEGIIMGNRARHAEVYVNWWISLYEEFEYSIDHGKSWHICGKEAT